MTTDKVTQKLSLEDLIGKGKKANADLYKNDPKRHENHKRYRTPRNRLINYKGAEYKRPMAGNAQRDAQYHELAREFVNNGLMQNQAIATVFGISSHDARHIRYQRIFSSSYFRSKVTEMMQGVDGEYAEPTKEYALQRLMRVLELNILDYVDDDGSWLTVREMKALPREMQVMLDDFAMINTKREVALTDDRGNVVRKENGEPYTIEHREQRVRLKLPNKTENLKLLGQYMKWLDTHSDKVTIAADMMVIAESRIKELTRGEDNAEAEDRGALDGESRRVSTD